MHKSKLLALLLAVVMVASMIVVPVYAAGGEIAFSLTADKTTVEPGGTVTLTLALTNNTGFQAIDTKIDYDKEAGWAVSNLTLPYAQNLTYNSLGGSIGQQISPLDQDPYTLILHIQPGIDQEAAIEGTGALMTLTFTAPQTPGEYEFTLNVVKAADMANDNMTVTTPEAVPVIVAEKEAAATACPLHPEEAWTEIAEGTWTGDALNAGHYKLTGNQTLTSELTVAGNVCIDLNGNSITARGAHRNFNVTATGTLVIMDSSKNKTGTINGGELVTSTSADNSSDANTWGGSIYAVDTAKVYIYGGKITGGKAARGGNICLSGGAELYMYGGTVTKGTAFRGGNIQVTNTSSHTKGSICNIYGGTISDGSDAYGGANLVVISSSGNPISQINIFGGTITGGSSTKDSWASVYTIYCTVNIYGGSITCSEALYAASGTTTNKSTINIYGGAISGDISHGDASKTALKIFNGQFSEDYSAFKGADCVCVDGNTVWHYAENCTCAYTAALDQYDEYIDPQEGKHTSHKVGTDGNFTYPCSVCNAEATVDTTNLITCAACGKDHDTTWTAWDGTQTNGHFYVLSDLALSGTVTVNDGETLCLDLNGQTVSHSGTTRMFVVKAGGTLNLMDSAKNGTLQGKRNAYSGSVINCAGTFNLYSGTIQDGHTRSSSNMAGGNIQIDGGTFNMTGGTIKNGKVQSTNAERYATGGNIYITGENAVANISGGVIEGGTCVSDFSQRGGNISVANGAQVTISGDAIIRGGQAALGESIYMRSAASDVVIKSGVTIGAGVDPEVADIFVDSGKLMTYEDPAALQGNWEAYNTTKDAEEATCYVIYATLTDALGAAAEGDTVNLAAEITDAGEIALDGFTLNLNGHVLTATSVDATINGGHVVDNAAVKGKVVGDVYTRHDNEMLHVVAGDDSYFEKVKIGNKPDRDVKFEVGNTVAKYTVYVDMKKDKTMIDEALVQGTVQLSVEVTLTVGDTSTTKSFVLDNDTLIAAYAENFNSKMLMVTISNIPEDVTALSCTFNVKKPLAEDTVE